MLPRRALPGAARGLGIARLIPIVILILLVIVIPHRRRWTLYVAATEGKGRTGWSPQSVFTITIKITKKGSSKSGARALCSERQHRRIAPPAARAAEIGDGRIEPFCLVSTV